MWLFTLAVIAAAPPKPLPEISAPLGHLGSVVEPAPEKVSDQAFPIFPFAVGCEKQVVFGARALSGTMHAVEQLQAWLNDAKPLEKTLFKDKAVLPSVVRHVTGAGLEAKVGCEPLPLHDGFQVTLADAPKKWCPVAAARPSGPFWFFNGPSPAALVHVLPGVPDACKPRLSVVLFDAKGKARVRLHADWATEASMTLVGDGCRNVDFAFDKQKQAFRPTLVSCKR